MPETNPNELLEVDPYCRLCPQPFFYASSVHLCTTSSHSSGYSGNASTLPSVHSDLRPGNVGIDLILIRGLARPGGGARESCHTPHLPRRTRLIQALTYVQRLRTKTQCLIHFTPHFACRDTRQAGSARRSPCNGKAAFSGLPNPHVISRLVPWQHCMSRNPPPQSNLWKKKISITKPPVLSVPYQQPKTKPVHALTPDSYEQNGLPGWRSGHFEAAPVQMIDSAAEQGRSGGARARCKRLGQAVGKGGGCGGRP